jgi:chromosome 3 open reading frame 10
MAEVRTDWENRQFIQDVQYNIMKMTNFLNKFDTTTRYRLATINEKLTRLERQVTYLDASILNLKKRINE